MMPICSRVLELPWLCTAQLLDQTSSFINTQVSDTENQAENDRDLFQVPQEFSQFSND